MATEYPADPIKSGETAKFRAHPAARPRTLRAIGADHWLTDIENFVQSELRRVDGGFSVMTTNGAASATYVFPTWREAMIHGL